jgi:6-pyruvoyl-tetrahydropterin synthase
MRTFTAAKGRIDAAHRDEATGKIHGHTWRVTVWWERNPRPDVRALHRDLTSFLAVYDHQLLDDLIPDTSGEAMASMTLIALAASGARFERDDYIAEVWA